MNADIRRDTPSGTRTANQIEHFARPREIRKNWSAVLFAICVVVDHDPVHDLFEYEQQGQSANAAAICKWYPSATRPSRVRVKTFIYLAKGASTAVLLQRKS